MLFLLACAPDLAKPEPEVADSGPVDTAADTSGDDTGTPCEPVTEACNGVDDDCDGVVDPAGADGCADWYVDADGDGVGGTDAACLCDADGAYVVAVPGDCDDADAAYAADCPSATEVLPSAAAATILGDVDALHLGRRMVVVDTGGGPWLAAGLSSASAALVAASLPDAGTVLLAATTRAALSADEAASEARPLGVADVDGDGVDELVTALDDCRSSDGGWYQLCHQNVVTSTLPLASGALAEGRAYYQSAQATDWEDWQPVLPGDVDADGRADVLHLEEYGERRMITPVPVATSGFTYHELATPIEPADALGAPGDIDGDGAPDLVWATCDAAAASVALGPVDLTPPLVAARSITNAACFTRFEAAGDVDGDGLRDLYAFVGDGFVHLVPGPLAAGSLAAVATGTFGGPGGDAVEALAAADLDGDGFADLAVGGDAGTTVLHGPWTGTVTPAAADVLVPGVGGNGGSLAAWGETLVIGAPAVDDAAADGGAAYIFRGI